METTTYKLGTDVSGDGERLTDDRAIRARVFGHLVQLSRLIVEMFQSDLYHDAMWLTDHLDSGRDLTFYFGVRPTGTSIGTDESLVNFDSNMVYRIDYRYVQRDKYVNEYLLDITPVR